MDGDGVIMRNSVLILARIDRIIPVITIHPLISFHLYTH
jgi:hypothetical protein